MALNLHRDLNRPITHFDNVAGQWVGVGLGYALAIASIGSVAIPWEHPAQKALRVLLPVAGMVCNIGASWKVRELQLMSPYLQDRAIARRDIGATITASQAMPYLQQPAAPNSPALALMPANGTNHQNSGLYAWERLIYEAVGIIIAGNSGAGKTSVACFLLGLLTQSEPKKIIVCDPHHNRLWKQLGLSPVGRIPDIERNLAAYVEEMDRRYDALADGAEPEDFEPMIIVLDELGKCQKKFSDPSGIEDAIARLGCEGRKVGMTAIIICHSQNVDDMGISKKLRNNYVLILLGGSALDESEKWKADDQRRAFIESQAYPCIVSGSIRNTPALHPTHYQYSEYKIQGNQPLNLLPINQIHGGDRPSISLDKSDTPPDTATNRTQWLEHLYRLDIQRLDTQTQGHNQSLTACPECGSTDTKGNGFYKGQARRRCKSCGKSWVMG